MLSKNYQLGSFYKHDFLLNIYFSIKMTMILKIIEFPGRIFEKAQRIWKEEQQLKDKYFCLNLINFHRQNLKEYSKRFVPRKWSLGKWKQKKQPGKSSNHSSLSLSLSYNLLFFNWKRSIAKQKLSDMKL